MKKRQKKRSIERGGVRSVFISNRFISPYFIRRKGRKFKTRYYDINFMFCGLGFSTIKRNPYVDTIKKINTQKGIYMNIDCGGSDSGVFRSTTILAGVHSAVGGMEVGEKVRVDGVIDFWGMEVPIDRFRAALNKVSSKIGYRYMTRAKKGEYPVVVVRVE